MRTVGGARASKKNEYECGHAYHVLGSEVRHEEEVSGQRPLGRVRVLLLLSLLSLARLALAGDRVRVHLQEGGLRDVRVLPIRREEEGTTRGVFTSKKK